MFDRTGNENAISKTDLKNRFPEIKMKFEIIKKTVSNTRCVQIKCSDISMKARDALATSKTLMIEVFYGKVVESDMV